MPGGIPGAIQLLKSPKRNLDKKGLEYTDLIIKSVNRSTDLTAKLLAFGRKGKITSTAENLDELKKSDLAGFIHKPFRDYELSKLLAEVLKDKKRKQ